MTISKWLKYMSFHSLNIGRRWSGWRRNVAELIVLTEDDSSMLKDCGKETKCQSNLATHKIYCLPSKYLEHDLITAPLVSE